MAYIQLNQVTKRFGSVTAVDRMDLEIAHGECLAGHALVGALDGLGMGNALLTQRPMHIACSRTPRGARTPG